MLINSSRYEDLTKLDSVEYMAGGSCQNSLRVTSWILSKSHSDGMAITFFGAVGEDDFAKKMEQKALADGLNVVYQRNKTTKTGTCAVILTGHDRSLCANLAAAETFTLDQINQKVNRKIVENAGYFYVTGIFLTVSLASVFDIAKHALSMDAPFLINLSAAFVPETYNKELIEVLPYADVIFGNENEAHAFAKMA